MTDQRRGIWQPKLDADGRPVFDKNGKLVEEWTPTTRRLRRNGLREFIGHSTRNGKLVAADGLSRAERRRRARELWRAGQAAQGR